MPLPPTPTPTAVPPTLTPIPPTPTATIYESPLPTNVPVSTWTPTLRSTVRPTDTPIPEPTDLPEPSLTATVTPFAGTFAALYGLNDMAIQITREDFEEALKREITAFEFAAQIDEIRSLQIRGRTLVVTALFNNFTTAGLLIEAEFSQRIASQQVVFNSSGARTIDGTNASFAQRTLLTTLVQRVFEGLVNQAYLANQSGNVKRYEVRQILIEPDRIILITKVDIDLFTPTAIVTPTATVTPTTIEPTATQTLTPFPTTTTTPQIVNS